MIFWKGDLRKNTQENFSEEILRKKSLRKKSENHETFMNLHDLHTFHKKCNLFTFLERILFISPRFYKGFETFSKYAVLLYVVNSFHQISLRKLLREKEPWHQKPSWEIFLRSFFRRIFRKRFSTHCSSSWRRWNPVLGRFLNFAQLCNAMRVTMDDVACGCA